MRVFVGLALLCATAAGTQAREVQLNRVDIVEYGIYTARTLKKIANDAVATGDLRPIDQLKLVKVTTTVPAEVGIRFGVRFIVDGTPRGEPVTLTYITRFPPQGLRNPDTGKTFAQNEFKWNTHVNQIDFRTYTLDNTWEAAPGEWSLEFWYQGRKLGEQKFTVVAPP